MRISVVPAQITTVEDKIVGNLSVQQAVLLGIPVLFGFLLALFCPPFGQFTGYKIVVTVILFILGASLALRIREKIIAKWLVLFATYCLRPKYYVYDKNTSYLRTTPTVTHQENVPDEKVSIKKSGTKIKKVPINEFERLEQLTLDRRANFKLTVGKKGKFNVHITEVK